MSLILVGCQQEPPAPPPSEEGGSSALVGDPVDLALKNMGRNKVLAAHSGAVFAEERSSLASGERAICGVFRADDAPDGGYIATTSGVRYAAAGGRQKVQEVCGDGKSIGAPS